MMINTIVISRKWLHKHAKSLLEPLNPHFGVDNLAKKYCKSLSYKSCVAIRDLCQKLASITALGDNEVEKRRLMKFQEITLRSSFDGFRLKLRKSF